MKTDPQLPPPPIAYRVMQAMMWPILKSLEMSCKETYNLCSEKMDRKLTPGESFRLRIHLLMCGICRHLPAQFRGLRELVRSCDHDHGPEESSNEHLSPEAKERIFERLKSQSKS
jgi:hypothetical protein